MRVWWGLGSELTELLSKMQDGADGSTSSCLREAVPGRKRKLSCTPPVFPVLVPLEVMQVDQVQVLAGCQAVQMLGMLAWHDVQ